MPKLFYVIGASGAGKDSLMSYCREALNGNNAPVVFAHRYITRPVGAGHENHICLSEAEFALRQQHGLFVMNWTSHNLHYGIGIEINQWLQLGFNVVVNGSREYLATAQTLFPNYLQSISIEADAEVIANRLQKRGRETGIELTERINRNKTLLFDRGSVIVIENNSTLEEAGQQLLCTLLSGLSQPA